ncbi:hypothetical protein [Acetobacter conturbans]|uniref:ABC transmembrane type-1 domain-containing protein n=1 Tax=Acetobacter conturbans TaxID=1737472 RepID=A0ABX0K108_9PROT|nr:hypothetical protein [Acetobacter conturbans]NHN89303.1 hypothetical protein [Acetobacter conturbans]
MQSASFPPGFIATHALLTFCAAVTMSALSLGMQRNRIWYFILVALWIPGTISALWLPSLLLSPTLFPREPIPTLISVIQGFFISPTLILPLMGALLTAAPGLSRTAQALGADRSRRVALIWLPLLRRRMMLGGVAVALLATLMAFALAWRPAVSF